MPASAQDSLPQPVLHYGEIPYAEDGTVGPRLLRGRAVDALRQCGPDGAAALPDLVALAEREPLLRYVVIQAIGSIGCVGAERYLLGRLEDDSEHVRMAAAEVLAWTGAHDGAVLPVVARGLEGPMDTFSYQAFRIIDSMGRAAAPLQKDLKGLLLRIPTDGDSSLILAALRQLEGKGRPATGDVCRVLFGDERESDERRWVVDQVDRAVSREAGSIDYGYGSALRDGVRATTRHRGVAMPDSARRLLGILENQLQEMNPMDGTGPIVRDAKMRVLAPTDGDAGSATPAELFRRFQERCPPPRMTCGTGFDFAGWARVQANFAVAGKRTVPFLREAMAEPLTRREALIALAAVGPEAAAAIPDLLPLLRHPTMGPYAIAALGQIGTPAAAPLAAMLVR